MDLPILVLAGNRGEFIDFCRRAEIDQNDGSYIYVSGREALLGMRAKEFIKIGTFERRKDYYILLEACRLAIKPSNNE